MGLHSTACISRQAFGLRASTRAETPKQPDADFISVSIEATVPDGDD
jgi:hypothetical protein